MAPLQSNGQFSSRAFLTQSLLPITVAVMFIVLISLFMAELGQSASYVGKIESAFYIHANLEQEAAGPVGIYRASGAIGATGVAGSLCPTGPAAFTTNYPTSISNITLQIVNSKTNIPSLGN